MALKDGKAAAAAAGKFEEPGANAPATVTEKTPAAALKVETAAAASVAASTAIAKAGVSSLMVAGKLETVFAGNENAIPAVEYGVLARLVGAAGNVQVKSDSSLLGGWIKLTMLSWNNTWVISPGDDSAEAKEVVAYSSDGVTIDTTGVKVDAYLQKLRDEGYDKANVKKYVELIGILLESEKKKDNEHIGNMVQVSLSPQSAKSFESYRLQATVKIRLGTLTPEGLDTFYVQAEAKTAGGNTFTLLKVTDKLKVE